MQLCETHFYVLGPGCTLMSPRLLFNRVIPAGRGWTGLMDDPKSDSVFIANTALGSMPPTPFVQTR
jgi:hypothetical protein